MQLVKQASHDYRYTCITELYHGDVHNQGKY